jgi:hypothetical protein
VQSIFFDHFFWEVRDFDTNVLRTFEWSVEVEIANVNCHELGASRGDDAVE